MKHRVSSVRALSPTQLENALDDAELLWERELDTAVWTLKQRIRKMDPLTLSDISVEVRVLDLSKSD